MGAVTDAMGVRPVILRTLDVGADKPLPGIPQESEENPFLGRRGIRLALAEPDLLRVQLRALLRTAAEHPIKIMFPMVTALAEFRAARAVAEELQEELGAAARDDRFMGAPVALPLGNALRTASYSASEMPQLEPQQEKSVNW